MASPSLIHAKNSATTLIAEGVEGDRPWAHMVAHSGAVVAELLKECSNSGWAVFVGAPRAVPGSLSAAGIAFIELSKLNAVIEHRQADQVISVQSGMSLAQLDQLLAKSGQWWPIAAAPDDTIYDIVACGDGGRLEHGFGGPRHLVLGLEAALPNGQLIKMGGKVVKNVTGYDVTKLFVGGRGTLGIPVLAHLRLFARPERCACLVVKSDLLQPLLEHTSRLVSSGLPLAVVEILSAQWARKHGTSWLSEFADNEAGFLSVVEVFEHEQVISEVLPQLQALVAPHLVQQVVRPSVDSQLSMPIAASDVLEISCPLSTVAEIVELFRSFGCAQDMRLRPGAGRLRFALPAAEPVEAVKKSLIKLCHDRGLTLSLALTEGELYRVNRLPSSDSAASEIISDIKQQFDPSGCLNPCASFQ